MRNLELMLAIKIDLIAKYENVINPLVGTYEFYVNYLNEFFSENPNFEYTEEQFNLHLSFVGQVYDEYIYQNNN